MVYYSDKKFMFWELFNEDNGTLVRSDIIGKQENPWMRSFPELIDVGIMGQCKAGKMGACKNAGVDCYQKGAASVRRDMYLEDYKRIVSEAKGKTFQIALGGAGDPNKHANFEEILEYTKSNGIVPNLTTSGIDLSNVEIKYMSKYCGAVAVSYYSRLLDGNETNEYTETAIKKLRNCLPTNIHYVISRDSIDEAIYRLENEVWPSGINAIIFLLYKPVGFGILEKSILAKEKIDIFIRAALSQKHPYRIGFDTCFTPILMDYKDYVDTKSIDACEAARFSMYIDSEMNAYPCSFDNQNAYYKVSLENKSIQEVWDSECFEVFRKKAGMKECTRCSHYKICLGGCALELEINMGNSCHRE